MESNDDLQKYRLIIEKSRGLPGRITEKNIFSIGARGYYENPTSDILAFFLDPSEEHGFGTLFLESLMTCISNKTKLDVQSLQMTLITAPSRETETLKKKRIDLILEGPDWVIVIENKLLSAVNNPLDDYEDYVRNYYHNKKAAYIFLSSAEPDDITIYNWPFITYRELLKVIEENLRKYRFNHGNKKWKVILREFILNLKEQLGVNDMPSEENFRFVEANYKEILELYDQKLREYKEYIKNRGRQIIGGGTSQEYSWGKNGTAIRFSGAWPRKEANITILLTKEGKKRLQIYLPYDDDYQKQKIHDHFKNSLLPEYSFSESTDSGVKLIEAWQNEKYDYKDYDKMIEGFTKLVSIFNSYYPRDNS